MNTKKECVVCCELLGLDKFVACPACEHEVCKRCQKEYAAQSKNIACMKCHCQFTKRFLLAQLGTTFVNTTWKALRQEFLLAEQKDLLQSTQPLVTWEKEYRRQKSRLRFGERMTIPERPKVTHGSRMDEFFPCPRAECRGFVEPGTDACGVCRGRVCRFCREPAVDGHVCNPDVIASLAALRQDSRACPRCAVLIHRTEGCNHMYCTHCQTHFDWASGKTLRVSTNGHYNGLASFARNLATRKPPGDDAAAAGAGAGAGAAGAGQTTDESEFCSSSLHRHSIPLDAVRSLLTPQLRQSLYEDPEVIKFAAMRFYDPARLQLTLSNTLTNLRVEYLMNDIDEARWKSRVYSVTMQHERDLHIANILQMYFQAMDSFQRQLLTEFTVPLETIQRWIDAVNTSLAGIAEEYGGTVVRIRGIFDAPSTPSILR